MTPHVRSSHEQGAYPAAFFEHLLGLEDRHFWFRGRNYLITCVVRRLAEGLKPPYRVLEVGCGNGNVLRHLARTCAGATVVGLDLFEEGLRSARSRAACPVVRASAGYAPFSVGFHLVGMFDVLEHTPDDLKVLMELRRLLVPGGILLLTVPAGHSLWSYFDNLSGHYRRYDPSELARKLRQTGFQVDFISHCMAVLYPFARLVRGLRARRNHGPHAADPIRLLRDEFTIVPLMNAALTLALRAEAVWIGRELRLPFGTSLLAVARRTESEPC